MYLVSFSKQIVKIIVRIEEINYYGVTRNQIAGFWLSCKKVILRYRFIVPWSLRALFLGYFLIKDVIVLCTGWLLIKKVNTGLYISKCRSDIY